MKTTIPHIIRPGAVPRGAGVAVPPVKILVPLWPQMKYIIRHINSICRIGKQGRLGWCNAFVFQFCIYSLLIASAKSYSQDANLSYAVPTNCVTFPNYCLLYLHNTSKHLTFIYLTFMLYMLKSPKLTYRPNSMKTLQLPRPTPRWRTPLPRFWIRRFNSIVCAPQLKI